MSKHSIFVRDRTDKVMLSLLGIMILALLFHSRAYWLLFPPEDPQFDWFALHAHRDLGYIEVSQAVAHWEGNNCITSLNAPDGSIYQLPSCSMADLVQNWNLKVRLACKYHVLVDPWGRFVRGWHDDCKLLDLIYLEPR